MDTVMIVPETLQHVFQGSLAELCCRYRYMIYGTDGIAVLMLLSSDLGCRSRQGSVRVGKVESSLQALGDSGSPTVRITSRPTPGYHKVSQ